MAPTESPHATLPSRHAKRAGKACEACRDRRTKCIGGVPCTGCKLYDRECVMRQQARRRCVVGSRWFAQYRRSTPADTAMVAGGLQPTPAPPPTQYFSPIVTTSNLPFEGGAPRLPITELETTITAWLSSYGTCPPHGKPLTGRQV